MSLLHDEKQIFVGLFGVSESRTRGLWACPLIVMTWGWAVPLWRSGNESDREPRGCGFDPWPGCELWCGSQTRLGSCVAWLWCRPVAAAPIRSLAWESLYASGAALKRETKKQKDLRAEEGNVFQVAVYSTCRPWKGPWGWSGQGGRPAGLGHGGREGRPCAPCPPCAPSGPRAFISICSGGGNRLWAPPRPDTSPPSAFVWG